MAEKRKIKSHKKEGKVSKTLIRKAVRNVLRKKEKNKKDKLEELIDLQKNLFSFYKSKRKWYREANCNDMLKTFVIALADESFEMLHLLNWKPWKNEKELDIDALKEEAIDALHFLLQIFILLGMDADEVLKCYKEKLEENYRRQREKVEYKAEE